MDIKLGDREKEFIIDCLRRGLTMAEGRNGEPFNPFLLLITDDFQESTRVLVGSDTVESLEQASIVVAQESHGIDFYGLVWDGRVTIDGVESDCILVEFGSKSHRDSSFVFLQKYISNGSLSLQGGATFFREHDNKIFGDPRYGSMLLSEWNTCVRAPFIVFHMVAAADGIVDEKEYKAFISVLTEAKGIESHGLKAAFQYGVETRSKQMEYLKSDFDPISELTKVSKIVEEHTQDQGKTFSEGLYLLGETVAKSSGGFLGFRSVDKEEKAVLAQIKEALSL